MVIIVPLMTVACSQDNISDQDESNEDIADILLARINARQVEEPPEQPASPPQQDRKKKPNRQQRRKVYRFLNMRKSMPTRYVQ